MGEISAGLETSPRASGGQKTRLPGGGKPKSQVLAEAGISTSVANRAEKVAAIPEAEFSARGSARMNGRRIGTGKPRGLGILINTRQAQVLRAADAAGERFPESEPEPGRADDLGPLPGNGSTRGSRC